MERRIRVAVVDDHPLFREGVVHTLAAQDDIVVLEQGATAEDAVRIARECLPDVIVLDLNMPGSGLGAIELISVRHPTVCILMLTVVADEERVTTAMRSGARGYLLKGVSGPELVDIVRLVAQGESYISPRLAASMLSRVAKTPAKDAERSPFATLTAREKQILSLVSHGLSNKEIGIRLDLTEKTVKHYLTSVLRKLHVRNRVEAALLGFRRVPELGGIREQLDELTPLLSRTA